MSKKRTFLWMGILLLLLILFAWAYHLYDKPHQSSADETVSLSIPADSLYRLYQADEHAADQKYMGKVIEVTGKISEIQHNGQSEIWILSTQQGGGGVNCELFPGARTGNPPKVGDRITVKGRCTGFLMDVNLADCVLSNK